MQLRGQVPRFVLCTRPIDKCVDFPEQMLMVLKLTEFYCSRKAYIHCIIYLSVLLIKYKVSERFSYLTYFFNNLGRYPYLRFCRKKKKSH